MDLVSVILSNPVCGVFSYQTFCVEQRGVTDIWLGSAKLLGVAFVPQRLSPSRHPVCNRSPSSCSLRIQDEGATAQTTHFDEFGKVHRASCVNVTPGSLHGMSHTTQQSHSRQPLLKMSDMWCKCATKTAGSELSSDVCECHDLAALGGGKGGGDAFYECRERMVRYPSVSDSLTDSDKDWASDGTTSEEEVTIAEQIGWKSLVTCTMNQWDSEPANVEGDAGSFDLKSGTGVGELLGQHSKHCGMDLAGMESQTHGRINFKESKAGVSFHTGLEEEQASAAKAPMWVKSTKAGTVASTSPLKGQDSLCPYTGAMPISSFSFSRNRGSGSTPHKLMPLRQNHPVNLFYDMSAAGGTGILADMGNVASAVHIPSREFHTAQSLAFETPESLQACRNRDSIMMERDDLDGDRHKKPSTWKKMKQKLWASVTPQCLRPEFPPGFLTSAAATRNTSIKRMETIKKSRARHEEDVLSAATTVKGYSRRHRYLVDKIEQSIV
ncbi:hypothetical protein BSKO_06037 [Bryopsis sp. KO-2023]|nr:hypothetical protein BSKO_06037 [Bryopsis sp. KO-2023]